MLLTLEELSRAITATDQLELVPAMLGPYGRHAYIAAGQDLDALVLDDVQDDCQLITFLPHEGQSGNDFRAAALQVAQELLAAWQEEDLET